MSMTAAEPRPAEAADAAAWDAQVLDGQPRAHYMQSDAWARTREASPWRALRGTL